MIKMSQNVQLGFTAEDQVGVNEYGTVVIKGKGHKTLHQYKLQKQERNVYQKDQSYDFPPGANDASIRSFSETIVYLQDKYLATLKKKIDYFAMTMKESSFIVSEQSLCMLWRRQMGSMKSLLMTRTS